MILTVDLASKMSAVIRRDAEGQVHRQFDSLGMSSMRFIQEVAKDAAEGNVDLMLVEDVPYGISSQAMTKPVLRLQGIVIAYAAARGLSDRLLFVNPSTWQRNYPGVATAPKGTPASQRTAVRAEAARTHAERLGYTPPDLVAQYVATQPEGTRILKKNIAPLEKAMTDYVDAFLMNHWAYSFDSLDDLRRLSGVQSAFI